MPGKFQTFETRRRGDAEEGKGKSGSASSARLCASALNPDRTENKQQRWQRLKLEKGLCRLCGALPLADGADHHGRPHVHCQPCIDRLVAASAERRRGKADLERRDAETRRKTA